MPRPGSRRLEVDLLVLEAAPEPFDEDVIGKAAAAVHADGNPMGAQQGGEAPSVNWLAWSVLKISGCPRLQA
jgi:hypothetical protein